LIVGTLFIVDFKLKKPSNKQLLLMIIVVTIAVTAILFFSKYHIIHIPVHERALIEELFK